MGENASLPREFYAISVAGFLFNLTGNIIQPIQTLYVLDLGASLLQIGLLYSAQTISVALLRIPLTLLSHRVGEDRMIGIGFVVRITAFLFYFAAPSYPWLIPIALYEVIANGSFFQLTLTKASNMLPAARQGDAMGRFMTFIMLGMFVGPLITGSLVAAIGYRQLFLVASTFPLAGMILFMLTSRGKEASFIEVDQLSTHKPQALASLRTIMKDRNVLMLSAIRTLYFMSNAMFMAFFAVYAVNQLNLDASVVALLFSVQGVVNTFIKLPAGRIADAIGHHSVLLFTFGVIILNYLGIAFATDLTSFIILLAVFGACWGARAVVEWSLLTSSVVQEAKTLAVSYLENFSFIGYTIGSSLAGWAAGVVPFSTIFLLAALVNVPAIPCILLMKRASH